MAEIYTCQSPAELNSIASALVEYHKDKIAFLYTPEAKSTVNQANIKALKIILNLS
jgi:hypothetical protein